MAKRQFTCENCDRELKVDEERTGREVRCPHCQHVMMVPEAGADGSTGSGDRAGGSGGEATFQEQEPVEESADGREAFTGTAEGEGAGSASSSGPASASKFSVTNVIQTSFRMFFNDFARFISLGLIVFSPMLVLTLVLLFVTGEKETFLLIWQVANWGAILLLLPLLSGAMMYGVIRRLRGEEFVISDCLSEALTLLMPLIGVSILQGLIVGAGLVLLILPGLVAITMLYVSTPALVIERTGVIDALKRSYELTSGNLLRIYGIIVILATINGVLMAMVLYGTVGLHIRAATLSEIKGFMAMSSVVSVLTNTLVSIAIATTYYFLRMDEEDTTLDELVHLFD